LEIINDSLSKKKSFSNFLSNKICFATYPVDQWIEIIKNEVSSLAKVVSFHKFSLLRFEQFSNLL
jgi:hypothetical protein